MASVARVEAARAEVVKVEVVRAMVVVEMAAVAMVEAVRAVAMVEAVRAVAMVEAVRAVAMEEVESTFSTVTFPGRYCGGVDHLQLRGAPWVQGGSCPGCVVGRACSTHVRQRFRGGCAHRPRPARARRKR